MCHGKDETKGTTLEPFVKTQKKPQRPFNTYKDLQKDLNGMLCGHLC